MIWAIYEQLHKQNQYKRTKCLNYLSTLYFDHQNQLQQLCKPLIYVSNILTAVENSLFLTLILIKPFISRNIPKNSKPTKNPKISQQFLIKPHNIESSSHPPSLKSKFQFNNATNLTKQDQKLNITLVPIIWPFSSMELIILHYSICLMLEYADRLLQIRIRQDFILFVHEFVHFIFYSGIFDIFYIWTNVFLWLSLISLLFYRSMSLVVPDQYGLVLLSGSLMGLSILLVGFFFAGRIRNQIFTEQYLKDNFGAEHRGVTGAYIKAGGYPDNGNGIYSRNLSYEQWYKFNNAQRAHMNYVEWIACSLVLLLVAGLQFPITSASLGLAVIVGRFLYAYGYTSGGPSGRSIGVLINDLAVLALFILSIIAGVNFIQGNLETDGQL